MTENLAANLSGTAFKSAGRNQSQPDRLRSAFRLIQGGKRLFFKASFLRKNPANFDSKENKMDAACSIQTDIHGLMLIFICVKHSGYTHIFMRNFLQNSLAVFYLVQHLRIKCLVFEHCDLICVRSKRILLVFSDVRRFHNFGNVFQLRMMRNII